MADPYLGPLVVVYARYFSEYESEELDGIRAAVDWIEEFDDAYALKIQTPDGRVLYERETGKPSLKWHVRAVDAPPLPSDSFVLPWTPDPPRRPPKAPETCPVCGEPTVEVNVEPIEGVHSYSTIFMPGPIRATCAAGHEYGPEPPSGRKKCAAQAK